MLPQLSAPTMVRMSAIRSKIMIMTIFLSLAFAPGGTIDCVCDRRAVKDSMRQSRGKYAEMGMKKRRTFAQLPIRKLRSFIRLWRVILPMAVIFGFAKWYSLREFWRRIKYHESRRLSYHCRGATISLRRSRNITLAFSVDLCYNGIIS